MERRHVTDHQENECQFRQFPCKYCGYTDTYDAIAGTGCIRNKDSKVGKKVNHYDECGHCPVECPNKCPKTAMKRKDMKKHRQTCPLEPLDCQFITVGCTSKILRQEMDHHCQENIQAHLLMLLKSNNELVQKNKELVQQNQQLTDRIKNLEGKDEDSFSLMGSDTD